jgi:hypothetical protein
MNWVRRRPQSRLKFSHGAQHANPRPAHHLAVAQRTGIVCRLRAEHGTHRSAAGNGVGLTDRLRQVALMVQALLRRIALAERPALGSRFQVSLQDAGVLLRTLGRDVRSAAHARLAGEGAAWQQRRPCLVHRTDAGRLSRDHGRSPKGAASGAPRPSHTPHVADRAWGMAAGAQGLGRGQVGHGFAPTGIV